MKKKIAICLVTLLAVLLATPIQAHALVGGIPPINVVSIDNGSRIESYRLADESQPTYYLNRMSGFAGKTITRVWAHLYHTSGELTMTLLIYSGEPALDALSDPLVEQQVTVLATEGNDWYSFDLTTPLTVPFDTNTLYVGFLRAANPTELIYFGVDNSGNGGDDSFMGYIAGEIPLSSATYVLPYNFMIRAEYLDEGEFTITVDPTDHGTIVADRTHANVEEIINVRVTPDDGYRLVINSLYYNEQMMNGTSFWMPGEDVVITGEFEQIMYNVAVAPLEHGTIETDKDLAGVGDIVTVTITPEAGYRMVAGSLMYNSTAFTGTEFTMPSEDVLVSATFELIPFEIEVEVDSHGSFGSDKELALPGETVTVTVTPNAGYRLVAGSLKYNGIAIEGTTFVMPAASVTITGDFELINQIPDTGDALNMNTVSTMMVLGFALVLGSVKKKKTQK